MGFLDRLFGRQSQPQAYQPQQPTYGQAPAGYPRQGYPQQGSPGRPGQSEQDRQAIARYRYLLQTAPPEAVEQAHAEAFARLTPEQRRQVLQGLADGGERVTADDPQSLARAATRAEYRQPGFMERTFGGLGRGGMGGGYGMGMGGMGMGGMIMGSMLGSIAGSVIGTAIAHEMMDGFDAWDHDTNGGQSFADGGFGDGGFGGDANGFGDPVETSGDGFGGDQSFADDGFSDGGGFDGGFGGDGFGDFGGGDFGGGDFGGDSF
ncbi:hypothetical protein [Arsenicicoccus dermatophilus]|uniref:hypothetical protein n=1 Tax=Arsenicicoccus dermatophilus TaxID=1076331 RepID=UPI003917419B